MRKKLVLIGGGHAHMVPLANMGELVRSGVDVTVIGPSEHHYYSGMGPGMLSGTYTAADIRFRTRHVVEKHCGTFLLGKAEKIDPDKKQVLLEDGQTIPYDVLSCNAGSQVPTPRLFGDRERIFSVKPIERLLEAKKHLVKLFENSGRTVIIAGGGPSSAEVAGNVWGLGKKSGKYMPRIMIIAGGRFMGSFPDTVRNRTIDALGKRDIHIMENSYVEGVSSDLVVLDSGEKLNADFVFLALGVRPSPIFSRSKIPIGPDGGMRVNKYLQSTMYPEIFGGGDCIFFEDQPLDKVGVYAVRENPVLYHNLNAQLNGQPLMPFDPGGDYLLIFNLGDGAGILKKRWLEFGGKAAFFIKDYIDKKFMKKFQAIE